MAATDRVAVPAETQREEGTERQGRVSWLEHTGRKSRAQLTVLYDGTCGFCTRQALLARRVAGEHVELASTAEPATRARFPKLTTEATNRQLYVYEPDPAGGVAGTAGAGGPRDGAEATGGRRDAAEVIGDRGHAAELIGRRGHATEAVGGRMYGGASAVARLVREVPVIGPLGWLYYLPGLRQTADALYRLFARNRHRISRLLGWQPLANDSCADGACALPQRPKAA